MPANIETEDLGGMRAKTLARLAELEQAHPCPSGLSADFWNMLRLQASMGDNLASLLLKQGVCWGSEQLVQGTFKGVLKACFQNSSQLVLESSELVYVEGYACTKRISMVFPHAWVQRPDGTIEDPTWEDGHSYVGIPFSSRVVRRLASETGYWGVFGFRTPKWLVNKIQRWSPPGPVDC